MLSSRHMQLLVIFIYITLSSNLFGQIINWQESQGLSGQQILCLARSPLGYYFAGTQSGIYRSTDNGITWNKTITPDNVDVRGLVVNSSGYVFATNYSGLGGILKSTDNGNSWQFVLTGFQMYSIGITKNGIIFAGQWGSELFKSTDNGISWSSVGSGLPTGSKIAITIDSNDRIFVGIYGGGVFRSTDLGITWTSANNGLLNQEIKSISVAPNGKLFVSTFYTNIDTQGLYLSTDGGNSWTKTGTSIPPSVESIVFNSIGHLFLIGPGDGIRRSIDDGNTWEFVNNGFSLQTPIGLKCIMLTPTEELILGTSLGIFRTISSTLANISSPSGTSLSSPPNGAVGVSKNLNLSWNSSPNAASYNLQISTNQNFTSLVVDQSAITTTWFPVSNLANNTTYYWKVNCKNAGGTSNYSSTWSFTTIQLFSLTLLSNPSNGGSVTGGGNFEFGNTVTVIATPALGYTFINWTEGGIEVSRNSNYMFSITGNRTLTANFLAVPNPPWVSSPTSVTQTSFIASWNAVNSASGYYLDVALDSQFNNLLTEYSNKNIGNVTTYTVNNLTPQVAYYCRVRAYNSAGTSSNSNSVSATTFPWWVLTITINPALGGTVSGAGNYISGNNVIAVATPNAGYTFTGWTGDTTSLANPLTVMMIGNKSIKANFAIKEYSVSLVANPANGGTVSGSGNFNFGSSVTVIATAKNIVGGKFHFLNWTENGSEVSKNASYTFTVTANRNLVANFLDITSVKDEGVIPTKFNLLQNYPNPFNPTTKIKFGLPEHSITKLFVYDILGSEVTCLIDRDLEAGYHEISFDASNLPSGKYFYRISTPKYSSVKKLILMK